MVHAGKFEFRGLHQRYAAALVVVALLALAGLTTERGLIESSQVRATLASVAGRQRELPQRIAGIVYAAVAAADPDRYAALLADLRSARNELLAGHRQLIAYRGDPGSWHSRLETVYFGSPSRLDERIRRHVAAIDRVLLIPFEQRESLAANPVVDKGLLDGLEAAVVAHETLLGDELELLTRVDSVVFLINIVALGALGGFVFLPLVRRFREEHATQQQTYRKLLDQMAERYQLDRERNAAEARFRIAFENAPIGIGLMYADGRLFNANPAMKTMFREIPHDALFPFDRLLAESDRERFQALVEKVLNSGKVQKRKLKSADADGNDMYLMVSLSPVSEKRDGIEYIVLQVEDVTESHSLNTRLEYQATYDELTGLMNRRAFNRKVEEAWNASNPGKRNNYLLMMDLDQFKIINDTSGHAAGDQLLRRVSEVIKTCVRNDDLVCRLGGDEFGVVLLNCPGDVATRIAETIRSSVDDLRFAWGAETYRVGVSIGGVAIDPALGDVSEIQQLADSACYAAKEAGRNNVQMVTEGKDDARRHRRQIRWVQRIRDAMERDRFAIYGQDIAAVHPDNDTVRRVEVLIRLRDADERRLIPPGAFLPAAERYGLNIELDQWVVSNLIQTLFVHQAINAEPVQYWVNLSGNSVGDERFATALIDIMRRSPLPPGMINFEITETAVIRNIAAAGRLMHELRAMGSRLALDDFGSGLSSFGYLKHLPIDYLKIDGMFIREIESDPTNRIFVKSIIDIAHSLDIRTVAEFVESDTIAGIVTKLGVDYLQGYAISRPWVLAPELPANDLSALQSGVMK